MLGVPIRADSSCLLHWRIFPIFPGATGCQQEASGRMSLEDGRMDRWNRGLSSPDLLSGAQGHVIGNLFSRRCLSLTSPFSW